LHFEVLSGEEAAEREPGLEAAAISAAFAFSDDGQVDPHRLWNSLRLAAAESGVQIFETGFVRDVSAGPAATWKVEAAGTVFLTTALVQAIEDPGVRLPTPLAASLPAVSAVFVDLDGLGDARRLSRALVAPGTACRPLRSGGIRLVGPGENVDGRVAAGEVTRLLSELACLLPCSREYRFEAARSRLLSFGPDMMPVAGEASHAGGFLIGGLGFDTVLLLPAVSSLVADLLTGRKPALAAATLSPLRLGG
jgi:glycine/D-amino acid oxidase-like deaminating enzyme